LADQIKPTQEHTFINIENIKRKVGNENDICNKIWDGKEEISACIIDSLDKYLKTDEKDNDKP